MSTHYSTIHMAKWRRCSLARQMTNVNSRRTLHGVETVDTDRAPPFPAYRTTQLVVLASGGRVVVVVTRVLSEALLLSTVGECRWLKRPAKRAETVRSEQSQSYYRLASEAWEGEGRNGMQEDAGGGDKRGLEAYKGVGKRRRESQAVVVECPVALQPLTFVFCLSFPPRPCVCVLSP